MAQGSIIKAGIHSDEANLPKRGFPVSIKDDNGKESVIAGDIVTASDKGFKKTLDGHGVGIVIRGGSNYAEILLKSL